MPYAGSGYRRDTATGKWLSPEEQQRRRDRRDRIAWLVATCSANELEARVSAQKALVIGIFSELKAAEGRANANKARIHAAVDDIARIARDHHWLRIYFPSAEFPADYEFLGSLLPSKIDSEPYARLARKQLEIFNVRASVEAAITRASSLSKMLGWKARLEELRRALPELERAVANLNHVSVADIRAKGIAANATRHELIEALEQRKKAEDEAERKRRSAERRRYEKARLAAIDEKTRQGVGVYRELVEFTGSCAYCEATIIRGVNAHLDHIIPVVKGGLNSIDNLAWACDRCNLLKSDKSFHRFCKAARLDPDKTVARLHALGKYI